MIILEHLVDNLFKMKEMNLKLQVQKKNNKKRKNVCFKETSVVFVGTCLKGRNRLLSIFWKCAWMNITFNFKIYKLKTIHNYREILKVSFEYCFQHPIRSGGAIKCILNELRVNRKLSNWNSPEYEVLINLESQKEFQFLF